MLAKIVNDVVEKYPYSIGELRKDNPNVSFPRHPNIETLSAFNVFEIVRVGRPEVDHTQDVKENPLQKINGVWTQSWNVYDVDGATLEERTIGKSESVRQERDQKLSQSDWTQVADAPVDKTAWVTYRQALRDVPLQEGFPWEVVWPVSPN